MPSADERSSSDWIRPPSPGTSVAPSYHTYAPAPAPAAGAAGESSVAPVGIYRQFCATKPSRLEIRPASWLGKPIRAYDGKTLSFTYRARPSAVVLEHALCNPTGQAYCTVSRHPLQWEMQAHTAQSHQRILTLRKPDDNWGHLLLQFRDLVSAAPSSPSGDPAWAQWELIHDQAKQELSARASPDGPILITYRLAATCIEVLVAKGVDALLAALVGCILLQENEMLRSQSRRKALGNVADMVSGGWMVPGLSAYPGRPT